jgi:hypothetical protein
VEYFLAIGRQGVAIEETSGVTGFKRPIVPRAEHRLALACAAIRGEGSVRAAAFAAGVSPPGGADAFRGSQGG